MNGLVTYEERLNRDTAWALLEGSMHFENASAVHTTMRRVARRLDDLGIPYAVVGGMAMFLHGFRRFTEDVDILVTRESLKLIQERLTGLGYLPPFEGSKNLRDTESGVRIEFLVAGGYPGDGLPKPVTFPDPAGVSAVVDDIRVVNLSTLIQLKLASGTAAHRVKDLGDVQELIRVLRLPESVADQLDESVRERYRQLWAAVRDMPTEE